MVYDNVITLSSMDLVDKYVRCFNFTKFCINTDVFEEETNSTDGFYYQYFRIFVEISDSLIMKINNNEQDSITRNCFHSAILELNQAIKKNEIFQTTHIEVTESELNSFKDYNGYKTIIDEDFFVKHNYWYMQLHPNNPEWNKEKELLEKFSTIGLNKNLNDKAALDYFEKKMEKGDIVMICLESKPIALVEILDDKCFEINSNDDLLWFNLGRKVRVLTYWSKEYFTFSNIRGTLKKITNEATPTYIFINNWYREYINIPEKYHSISILKMFVENYKMFDDVIINTIDKNKNSFPKEQSLPVVVFSGINGCGKTSLLEAIYNLLKGEKFEKAKIKLETLVDDNVTYISTNNNKSRYKDMVVYFPIEFGNTEDLKKLFISFIEKKIYEDGVSIEVANQELTSNINEILSSIDCSFYFLRINAKKQILFKNKARAEFPIEALSTGEQALLTKIVKLYLAEVKGKIVLIDEPEISLHPNWQVKLLKMYQTFAELNNCQIFIATHSPHIIMTAPNNALKILYFYNNSSVECIDSTSSYGNELYEILHDIMGVNYLRAPEIQDFMDRIRKMIEDPDSSKKSILYEIDNLQKEIGDNIDIQFLRLEVANKFRHHD